MFWKIWQRTKRIASVKRKTTETEISAKLNIDGSGKSKIKTGIGFLDHMLELFAFWGLFDLEITTKKADLNVDIHHTNEDIAIVLGQVFKKALGEKKGITRMTSASAVMEEVVANVILDISGRPSFKRDFGKFGEAPQSQEGYGLKEADHFFESLANQLGCNLKIDIRPLVSDLHGTLEPAFKALGIALDKATKIDPRRKGVASTKGVID